MLVYCFQYGFIDGHGITLAKGSHPLFLQLILVVFHHLITHIGIIIGVFLQLLAVDGIDGIVFVGFIGLAGIAYLEDHTVYRRIVACLEDAFLHTDADNRIRVEGGAQCLCPLIEGPSRLSCPSRDRRYPYIWADPRHSLSYGLRSNGSRHPHRKWPYPTPHGY